MQYTEQRMKDLAHDAYMRLLRAYRAAGCDSLKSYNSGLDIRFLDVAPAAYVTAFWDTFAALQERHGVCFDEAFSGLLGTDETFFEVV